MEELTVIFPCYNEEERLPQLFEALQKFKTPDLNIHYIIVDDASTDGSVQMIESFISGNFGVSLELVAKRVNAGKGPAVAAGDDSSKTELRCFLDVDLSTPLDFIPIAASKLKNENLNLLIGSRHCPGAKLLEPQGALRYSLGRLFSFFTSVFHQSAFSDTQCGFKVWTKNFSENVISRMKPSRWSFDIEWILRAEKLGYRIGELPVTWKNDERSKVSAVKDGIKMARDVLVYRLSTGSKATLFLSIVMLIVGLSMALRSSNDMQIYLNKAWIPLSDGISDIYEPMRKGQGGYYYSALFAVLGIPFSWFSIGAAKVLFYLLYISLAISGWVFVKRLIRYAGFNFRPSFFISGILIVSLMNNHFGQALSGNLSAQITALMIASGYFYFLEMKKTSAALLCLAINFKVYPAFLLLFFLIKLDYKYLFWCLGFSLLFLMLPALYVGWEQNIHMHLKQIESLRAYGPQNDFGRLPFQSLTAMAVRASRVFEMSEQFAMRTVQVLGSISVLVFYMLTKARAIQRELLTWIFAMLMLGLIAPASWVHHFGFVYAPAILFVLGHIFTLKNPWQITRLSVWGFYVFVILYAFTTQGVVGRAVNNTLESWSVPTLGIIALLAAFISASRYEINKASNAS